MASVEIVELNIIDIKDNGQYDAVMRTTVTIDDDVAIRIEERRRRDGQSLKQVINMLLREGLRSSQRTPGAKEYRTRPHGLRMRPGLDAVRLNQLVDELETDTHREQEAQRGE